jgi:hypothetical protein
MKIGISINLDVTKIDKARIVEGKKGKYIDITAFIDLDQADEYGNHGMVTQNVTKEERAAKVRGPIIGNAKVFYKDGDNQPPVKQVAQVQNDFEDIEIPF